MIVAGRDIGDKRTERIEGRLVTHLTLFNYLHLDLIQRDMTRAFDHDLDVGFPSLLRQLTQRLEFGELSGVAGIGDAAGPETVTEGVADVILLEDLRDRVKVLVEEVLAMVLDHPFGQNRPAAADDTRDAL